MADLRLVGAVAIKVRPDAKGFRRETDKQVKEELKGYSAEVEVEAKVDTSGMAEEVEKAKEEIEKKVINLKVGTDYDSIRQAQAQLDRAIKEHMKVTVTVNLDDPDDVAAKLAELQEDLEDSSVEITYVQDQQGYNEVLRKIAEVRRQKLELPIEFTYDEDGPNGLRETEERIRAELDKLAPPGVTFEYDVNEKGLAEARARILTLLGRTDPKITIEAGLDTAALEAKLAEVDRLLAAQEANKRKIKFEADMASLYKTFLAISFLTKNRSVTITANLRDNTLLTAAKLTGLRAASRWTEEFGRAIGTLDRKLPIVAAATMALSALSAGAITLAGDMFSLGNGLGQVLRMGAVLIPTLVTGLAAVMTVFTGVFKDFGAAVNGDEKAIEKLTESGKKAAAQIRVHFQDIRETVSKNFWEKAGDSMLRFSKTALPAVGDGLARLSSSMGKAFGGVLDSFNRLAQNDGVTVFFKNLSRGFDVAAPGIANFFDAFNKLAVTGSTIFVRLAGGFNDISAKFKSWVDRIAADGTLKRWIDMGIEGLKQLWNSGMSIVRVWKNIGTAAQSAGAMTLGSFENAMKKLEQVTAGARFQRNMRTIFAGAREASDIFHDSLKSLAPAMDVFSKTIATTLSGSARALGAFITDIGDVISSPRIATGLSSFMAGLTTMFQELRPAAGAVADIIGTVGTILGTVATDSGPLFRDLFITLASVLDTAWTALQPFLPDLVAIGQTVINTLGPVLSDLAQTIIPAFSEGLIGIGDGIGPVIRFFGDMAVGAVKFISAIPPSSVIGIATAVLTLGTHMQFAATMVPLAVAALNTFRATAAITATTTALLVPGVGLLLAALTGFTAFAISDLAESQRDATPYAEDYATALKEDAKAAEGLGTAVEDATTKVALHKLVTSGAYEAAEKLGIGSQTVTDAVLKGGDALQRVRDKISGAKSAYDEATASALLYAQGGQEVDLMQQHVSDSTSEQSEAAKKLDGILNDNVGSLEAARKQNALHAKVAEEAGIATDKETEATEKLAVKAEKLSAALSQAAAASATLTDEFAGDAAKVDAMRKTLDLVLGPNTKMKVAEGVGAYKKGFADLTESVKSVAPELQKLGDKAFGEKGFLNVASGNAAVLQVNQALVDQVNNTWAAAKTVYDNTLRETGSAETAFKKAKQFVDTHKGDYNDLAESSGVAASQVQGQWDAVFGHEWVLKISLRGATEATVVAEQLVAALNGKFDGKEWVAMLDADPALALLAIKDPVAAATEYVNRKWRAKLEALPGPAQDTLRKLTGMTEEQWNRGDFQSILTVSRDIPGLAQALIDINNGVNTPRTAIIKALADGASLGYVEAQLQYLENKPRYVKYHVTISDIRQEDAMGARVQNGSANGSIMNRYGIGMHGFNPKYFANGGIERHVAQIQRAGGPVRIWAEPETGSEAYIPYASSKRPRSVAILAQVAKDFGYNLSRSTEYSNGGIGAGHRPAPSTHNTASVHIGQLVTADADEAVRKIRISQQDALAVAGISLNGA